MVGSNILSLDKGLRCRKPRFDKLDLVSSPEPLGTTPVRGRDAGGSGKSNSSTFAGEGGSTAELGCETESDAPGEESSIMSAARFLPLGTTVSVLETEQTEDNEAPESKRERPEAATSSSTTTCCVNFVGMTMGGGRMDLAWTSWLECILEGAVLGLEVEEEPLFWPARGTCDAGLGADEIVPGNGTWANPAPYCENDRPN